MKLSIIILFWLLLTLAFVMGDVYAIALTLAGFMIMLYFVDEQENE